MFDWNLSEVAARTEKGINFVVVKSQREAWKMSDVDDDFMCEDEEDYGLVSGLKILSLSLG